MSRIFDKLNGILLAGLFGGLLVAGIGSGIAFAEYMSFEYDDETLAAESERVTEEYSYEMAAGERVVIPSRATIEHDDSVAPGTVVLTCEYASSYAELCRDISVLDYATVVDLYPSFFVSDFDVFMQNKDVILEGLRNGVLLTGGVDYQERLSAKINPADKGRVFTSYEAARRAYEEAA